MLARVLRPYSGMSELERQLVSDPANLLRGGTKAVDEDLEADTDADLASEPEGGYTRPLADVGDAQRGEGTDRVGGYGNRAIPQEGGPDQDH